jgi:L-methionine (R)-S-oxide reductase
LQETELDKKAKYIASLREIEIRLQKGGDLFADLGNIAAVLKKRLSYFWVGFYLVKDDYLVLGPFQGTPACVFLGMEKGVCATCIKQREMIIVTDVRKFPGHVACDPYSRSEIAVPLFDPEGNIKGVLDADSDQLNMFDATDQFYLEQLADRIRKLW